MNKQRAPFILLIISGLLFTLFFYQKIIFRPDHYLFNNTGDAIKNYFTYAGHIKNDTSLISFQYMNYPYGENFMYTDCHPILTALFRLAGPESFFSVHSIGILNFLMILSIFITFVVCYFLLKELKISNWFSLLFSLGITILSPQIFRMGGHLALSYSFAIPLSWLILLKSYRKPGILYPVLLFVNCLFWFFIHAYLGMIVALFLVVIITGMFIRNRKNDQLLHLIRLAAVILPVVIFFIFIQATDTHSGRTQNPSGLFLYNAEFDDVFLPAHPPLRPVLDKLTGNIIHQQWEAMSYVGLSTTLIVLCVIFLLFRKLILRKPDNQGIFDSVLFNLSILGAAVCLAYAMAFPFKQIRVLPEWLPVIKAFRATGRFAWPFYFTVTSFGAYFLYRMYSQSSGKKRIVLLIISIFCGISLIVEGIPYHSETSSFITRSSNYFSEELLPDDYKGAIKSIDPAKYQAILPLPFFYNGSETYFIPGKDETTGASMIFSYHTGIPLMGAELTRTAVWESKNLVQILSPDYYKKAIQRDIDPGKTLLIFRTNDPVSSYEEDILRKSDPVYQGKSISLYTLKPADLFKSSASGYFDDFHRKKEHLFVRNGFYTSDSFSFLFYDGFENKVSEKVFRSRGGYQSVKKGKNVLAEFQPGTFKTGKEYLVSIWMFNGMDDALNNFFRFIIEEYNEKSNTWESTIFYPWESQVIYGNWSLVEAKFRINDPSDKIYIVTKGKDDSTQPFYADDLLIRESGLDVYGIDSSEDTLFFNNQEIVR